MIAWATRPMVKHVYLDALNTQANCGWYLGMVKTIIGSLIALIVFFVAFFVMGRRKGDK
jgi:hypothetical protein